MIAARLEQLTPNSAARTTMPSSVGPLAALDAGSADAVATVLLLPGYTGSKEDFAPILDPLADNGYRAIAIDLPGQFESSGPLDEADYSPLALGAVCAEVVRDLAQHSPVVLLGHSFGGLVARGAVLAGAPIAGLVLLCSGPGALSDGARHDALLAAEPMLRLHGKELVYDNAVAGARAARKVVPPEVAELLRRRFIASTEVGLLGMGATLQTEPDRVAELRAVLDGAHTPVAVIAGRDDDAWTLPGQDGMARRLGTELVIVEQSAHSPAVENPDGLLAVLLPLLRSWRSSMLRTR